MEIKRVKLTAIKLVDTYRLSYPLAPEIYGKLREQLPHFPLMVVNSSNEIVFGIDLFEFCREQGIVEVDVLVRDFSPLEAQLLNYNLKERLTGVNLCEKLVFIKKALPLTEKKEIYSKTALDVNINRELEQHLDTLLGDAFRKVLVEERVTLKAALQLCRFQPEDRSVLLELFEQVAFSSSHQLKIIEMTEEILFRDKQPLRDIFETLNIEQYLEMEKPQKSIIDVLFQHRSPAATAGENQWREEIKALNLPENMQVTHFPFFEKRQVELTVRLNDSKELKKIIDKIKE
jgi:hypothetical protein